MAPGGVLGLLRLFGAVAPASEDKPTAEAETAWGEGKVFPAGEGGRGTPSPAVPMATNEQEVADAPADEDDEGEDFLPMALGSLVHEKEVLQQERAWLESSLLDLHEREAAVNELLEADKTGGLSSVSEGEDELRSSAGLSPPVESRILRQLSFQRTNSMKSSSSSGTAGPPPAGGRRRGSLRNGSVSWLPPPMDLDKRVAQRKLSLAIEKSTALDHGIHTVQTEVLNALNNALVGSEINSHTVERLQAELNTSCLFEPGVAKVLAEQLADPKNKVTAAWLQESLMEDAPLEQETFRHTQDGGKDRPLWTPAEVEWAPESARASLSDPRVRLAMKGLRNGSWAFDAFTLDDATGGHPLSVMGLSVLHAHDVFTQFPISALQAWDTFLAIEAAYLDNPYHNAIHAADVLYSLHNLLTLGGLKDGGINDPLEVLACLLAAVIHDIGHPGVNNDFLIRAEDPIAVAHNDRSPLENHHASAGWRLLVAEQSGSLIGRLPKADRAKLRTTIIALVLATDLKSHFDFLGDFQKKFRFPMAEEAGAEHLAGDSGAWLYQLATPQERLLAMQMALKCADLGHLSRDRETHLRWVSSLQEELWRQGDREMAMDMTLSPMNDRKNKLSARGQIGFFDVIVLPMYRSFRSVFPLSAGMANGVETNYRYWKNLSLEEAAAVPP